MYGFVYTYTYATRDIAHMHIECLQLGHSKVIIRMLVKMQSQVDVWFSLILGTRLKSWPQLSARPCCPLTSSTLDMDSTFHRDVIFHF